MKLNKISKNGKFAIVTIVLILVLSFSVSAIILLRNSSPIVKPMITVKTMATVSGASMRLDKHQGMMIQNATNVMAYKIANLTNPLNHYLVHGDWYDNVSTTPQGSIYCHYPITIANGDYLATESYYFNKADWTANSDGKAGTFAIGYDQAKWYNNIPVGSVITYNDDRTDNAAELYISNNTCFTVKAGTYNNSSLYCGAKEVMNPTALPVAYCYYNHNDYTDADWGWLRNQQGWSTTGLIQGTNTVYLAGTDASGNYTTGSSIFLYDNVKPFVNGVTITNITSSGYDFNVVGAGDATSGVVTFVIYTWSTDGNRNKLTVTLSGNQKDGINQTMHIPQAYSGGQNYRTDLYVYDKAGNSYFVSCSVLPSSSSVPSSSEPTSSDTTSSTPLEALNPVANFTVASPVAAGSPLNIKDYSTAGADDAYIDQEEWSYSFNGGNTWSDPTSTPPTSFDMSEVPATQLSVSYTIRLRVHAAWKAGTPEANAEDSTSVQTEALIKGKWSTWGGMKTVPNNI